MNTRKIHNIAFGLVIQRLRQNQRQSQERVAEIALIDRSYLSLLENGRRSPTLDVIIALCDALDIHLLQLTLLVSSEIERLITGQKLGQ